MNRILMAGVAIVFGAGAVLAASPEVAKAIKTIQSVSGDAAKMKLLCALDDAEEGMGEKEDPAAEKQVEDLLGQLGDDFAAAWDVGDGLDEKSPDAVEFAAAVEAVSEKCE